MNKLYIGCKVIQAEPMDEFTFMEHYKGLNIEEGTSRSGYKVTYSDGYISWSPKEVFENTYREVSEKELFSMVKPIFNSQGCI